MLTLHRRRRAAARSRRRLEEFQHQAVELVRVLEERVMAGLVEYHLARSLDGGVELVGGGKRGQGIVRAPYQQRRRGDAPHLRLRDTPEAAFSGGLHALGGVA